MVVEVTCCMEVMALQSNRTDVSFLHTTSRSGAGGWEGGGREVDRIKASAWPPLPSEGSVTPLASLPAKCQ